ncbi:hypothetical protein ID866_4325 [Astraeus odoratus]|nr:hypothetical protein ID866_4325 [Astraeus odoratus]
MRQSRLSRYGTFIWSQPVVTPLEQYRQQRAALLQADRSLRIDHARTASALEVEADRIVRRIRAEENSTVWGVKHEGKDIISQTLLFKILNEMPKGALLHVHLDLTVNAPFLLRLALEYPSIHIRTPAVVTPDNASSIVPEIKPLDSDFVAKASSLTDVLYSPGAWVPLHEAREQFSPALGGPEGFDTWVTGHMSINCTAAYETHNNYIRIWDKFRAAASLHMGLVYYKPIWGRYIRQFLEETVSDECLPRFMIGADGKENVPHIEWLRAFKEVVDDFKKERQDFFDAKVFTVFILLSCVAFTAGLGFDLVGQEDALKPLKEYLEPLLAFRECQKREGVSIPYIFHGGETCGDGTHADENLYDAILLGTRRIGHGFSLAKHPKLMQMCKEQGIALEVCPIS